VWPEIYPGPGAARALEALNEILDHGGADMFTNQATSSYLLRARAHAELARYLAAYADMDEYARRSAAEDAAGRDRNKHPADHRGCLTWTISKTSMTFTAMPSAILC
jgi:hypothetical protein